MHPDGPDLWVLKLMAFIRGSLLRSKVSLMNIYSSGGSLNAAYKNETKYTLPTII